MFKEYESKPVTRKAHRITERDEWNKVDETEDGEYILATYDHPEPINFKADEEPKVGDYVVYLNMDDIYHYSKKVFEERNIVPDPKVGNWGVPA